MKKSKYRASFVGMGPMPDPRIVVAVSVDEPTTGSHFGGQVSGPVFSAIVGDTLRALNVPPDMPVKQMVVSGGTASGTASAAQSASRGVQKLISNSAVKKLRVASDMKNSAGVMR